MVIVFRADASLQIGSGHVMRCLTLAQALKVEGAECHFICREHSGHLIEFIRSKGFFAHSLLVEEGLRRVDKIVKWESPVHSHWLGATQQQDADASADIVEKLQPDWLVVDHYALDIYWEKRLRTYCGKLMVIDDLADRQHLCDILLDQNLGRRPADYASYVALECKLLIGPSYALLRPEFSELRDLSLMHRCQPKLKNILITMGGVDEHNATCQVLKALKRSALPVTTNITVVMGASAPWLSDVQCIAKNMPYSTSVVSNISDMAQRMVTSDLAIGAAGSTSWERCCLGVPSLMAVLADNQIGIGRALHANGSAILLGRPSSTDFESSIIKSIAMLIEDSECLKIMSAAATAITDGLGCKMVVSQFLERSEK